MVRKQRTLGIIVACLLLPPLLVSGLLKAGHYTFQTWKYSPSYHYWFLGPSNGSIDDSGEPVPGFDLMFDRYHLKIYRPQDVPPPHHGYIVSAQVVDKQGHGISEAELEVYDLAGISAETPAENVFKSGDEGNVDYVVASEGIYNVIVDRHGYLPIKKRVKVGPNGGFVKFVLPRAVRGGGPSRRLPASARW